MFYSIQRACASLKLRRPDWCWATVS